MEAPLNVVITAALTVNVICGQPVKPIKGLLPDYPVSWETFLLMSTSAILFPLF